jgi:RNA exonuclease 4
MKELIEENGVPIADALVTLRSHLPPNAILVGQNIKKDVDWLQLVEGLDFSAMIDLSALFRVWNPSRGSFTNFSQDHAAKVWLGMPERTHHDAYSDACISIALFNAYRSVQWNPMQHMQVINNATYIQHKYCIYGFKMRI